MNDYVEPDLLQLLFRAGPFVLFAAVFSVACTVWLLVSRIRGVFRPRLDTPIRDIAFLAAGPVLAVLITLVRASVAAQSYVRGGIDAEFPLIYGLSDGVAMCAIAFLSFVAGVIACALPSKANEKIA